MKVIYDLGSIKRINNSVIALGVFDGVHRGHQRILKAASRYAKAIKAESIAVTFYPHPHAESSISSLSHRLKLIAGLGIEKCVVINFTKDFSQLSADSFVKNVLIKKFSPCAIFVGENFTFGKGAQGDASLLKKYSRLYNFKLSTAAIVRLNNKVISSTLIRRLIMSGGIVEASEMLGRPVSILGTVVKGTRLGRKWGIPTANLNPHHEVMPPLGIYAARIRLLGKDYKAACYIGTKSTLKEGGEKFIEVHIIGFKKNIYSKDLEVQFVKKIRSDKKFRSEAELVKQIRRDVEQAKKILSRNN